MDLRQHPNGKGLEFPCEIELLAFARNRDGLPAHVEALLVAQGAQRTATPVTHRVSSAGTYVSVHVPVWVASREELERLYGLLQQDPEIQFRL